MLLQDEGEIKREVSSVNHNAVLKLLEYWLNQKLAIERTVGEWTLGQTTGCVYR